MEALQDSAAFSEQHSIESDVSETLGPLVSRPGGSRRRKQVRPFRSPWSSDTPTEYPQQLLIKKYQATHLEDNSPSLNNSAGWESPSLVVKKATSSKPADSQSASRKGPCCHCGTHSSPQWRKGPKNKPVLCNACGIRFLRNRHLGKALPSKRRAPKHSGPRSLAASLADDSADVGSPSISKRARSQCTSVDMDDDLQLGTPEVEGPLDAGMLEAVSALAGLQPHTQQQPAGSYPGMSAAEEEGDGEAGSPNIKAIEGEEEDVPSPGSVSGSISVPVKPPAAAGASASQVKGPTSMLQLLQGPTNTSSSGGFNAQQYHLAWALQHHHQQQQQQQLLLSHQQSLLLSAASTGSEALRGAHSSTLTSQLSAASQLQRSDSLLSPTLLTAGSSVAGSTGMRALLTSYSLQMQQMQGLLAAQQQHQAQGLLHGPSPLSIMSSASLGGLALGSAAGRSGLHAPAGAASAGFPGSNKLQDQKVKSTIMLDPQQPSQHQAARVTLPLSTALNVLGARQSQQ